MLFRRFQNSNGSAGEDLRRGMAIAARIANEYDYSHLVSCSVKQPERPKRAGFEGMLTDYDRILLQFGLHILCES